jgi:hypothetical protein
MGAARRIAPMSAGGPMSLGGMQACFGKDLDLSLRLSEINEPFGAPSGCAKALGKRWAPGICRLSLLTVQTAARKPHCPARLIIQSNNLNFLSRLLRLGRHLRRKRRLNNLVQVFICESSPAIEPF